MADGFVFFQSYYESISCLKTNKAKLLLFESICKYALYGEEPEQLPAEVKGVFISVRPNIDSSIKRRKASVSNGKKGGAPNGNQNAKKQPKNNPIKQPDINLNKDMERDMDKDKDDDREREKETWGTAHSHGKFNNVLLSDSELGKLMDEYPDWKSKIEKLSEHIASTGTTYQSHYATICKWARQDAERAQKQVVQPIRQPAYQKQTKADELDDFYKMVTGWANERETYGTYV